MSRRSILLLILLAIVWGGVPGLASQAWAQTGDCEPARADSYLDINNVRARVLNDGGLFWRRTPLVYEVPQGGGVSAIFAQTLLIGGLVDGELRTAAARYGAYEFWPGPIDEQTGLPPGDCGRFDRIYKVSRGEVADYEGGESPSSDLRDWPTGLGAPTLRPDGTIVDLLDLPLVERVDRVIDLDSGERPAFTGDQMLWWIMNDVGNDHLVTKTDPIGVEIHGTAFAFDVPGPLAETTFYRYRIHNKGRTSLDSSYVGVFQDPDLGDFDDDYVASDTSLSLAYTYNADDHDLGRTGYGYGSAPPATGIDFVRGPSVPAPGDSAWQGDITQADRRNLQMTNFLFFNGGGCNSCDPEGAIGYYHYMQSKWRDGTPVTYGSTGTKGTEPAAFMYPGDPVVGAYWSEFDADGRGNANAPSDRRYVTGSGPFTLEPGEPQELIVAVVWARGSNNLDSITELRRADRVAQAVADANFKLDQVTIDAPNVSALPGNGSVRLSWSNKETSNNFDDAFASYAPAQNAVYQFEGYEVYQFQSSEDSIGTRIATFDLPNGVTRVVDGANTWYSESDTTRYVSADGSDSGVRHSHVISGLTNQATYHFGVAAYAYQAEYSPHIVRSEMSRVSIEPRRTFGDFLTAADSTSVFDAIGVVPNPYVGASSYEVGTSHEVRFVNIPSSATITVFTLSGSLVKRLEQRALDDSNVPGPPVRWDLTNDAGRRLASGTYVAHVSVPGWGERIIKFSVIVR